MHWSKSECLCVHADTQKASYTCTAFVSSSVSLHLLQVKKMLRFSQPENLVCACSSVEFVSMIERGITWLPLCLKEEGMCMQKRRGRQW